MTGKSVSDSTSTRLDALPIEILLHIQRFLPTHAAALLALTSKLIRYKLGTNAVLTLRGEYRDISEARNFLFLLERDFPGYFVCHSCVAFHSLAELPSRYDIHNPSAALKTCRKHDVKAENALFGSEDIHYLDLRAALQDTGAAEQEAALEKLNVKTERSTVELVVRSNKILMRGRHFIKANITDGSITLAPDLWEVYVCDHVRKNGHSHSYLTQLKYGWVHRSCLLCPTDFQGHLVSIGEERYIFAITRWLDLGNCLSPNSPHYRSHMTDGSFKWVAGKLQALVTYKSGSIKAAFEDSCHDQRLRPYIDAAHQFISTMEMKLPTYLPRDDLSWFKRDID